MERLSLDAFKERAGTNEQEKKQLENLTGGILGACHVCGEGCLHHNPRKDE